MIDNAHTHTCIACIGHTTYSCTHHILYATHAIQTTHRTLAEQINKKNKQANVKPFMVKNYLWVFVNCLIENPAFDSQVGGMLFYTDIVEGVSEGVSLLCMMLYMD